MNNIKEQLYNYIEVYISKREETVETIINSAKTALTSETKSSAGDKHETGRAMLQLEMEKAGKQLHDIVLMKETLAKLNISQKGNAIHLGSLIITNKATYFLSISAGEINIDQKKYYAISIATPIGRLLLGKHKGDKITFNNTTIEILEII